jgi:hypothetical protein
MKYCTTLQTDGRLRQLALRFVGIMHVLLLQMLATHGMKARGNG